MSIAKYRAFITVAELGSLTKAAKQLGYSQPGISHMIDSLEKEAGFPLLIRNKDQIVPTENGKKVLYYCYQIIKNENYLQETISSINGLLTGTIKIGSYNSMIVNFVPKVIHAFASTYSNIEIHLKEQAFADFQENLPRGIIDIGFMNEFVPKGFEFIPLIKDPACLIMRRDHPFTSYKSIPLRLLNGCDFIMPSSGYDDIVNEILSKGSFSPNIKHYVASDIGLVELVSHNLGVSIISRLQVDRLPESVIAKDFTEDFHRNLGIAIKSIRHTTPAIKEFIRISQEVAEKMNQSNFKS